MNRRFIINHFVTYGGQHTNNLIILWLLGICVGLFSSRKVPFAITYELQICLLAPQSPLGFLTIAMPLMLAIIFLWCSQITMLYPLVFITAVFRGYTAFMIFSVFGTAAWLARILLLFSGGVISVLFWLFLLRHTPRKKPRFATDILVSAIFLIALLMLERSLISPCLQQIIKYL